MSYSMTQKGYHGSIEHEVFLRAEREEAMSPQELAGFAAGRPFFAIAQDRLHPLHMKHSLPKSLMSLSLDAPFEAEAQPGEFFAFQVGVAAMERGLSGLAVRWDTPRSSAGAAVTAQPIRCFNLGGIDDYGRSFQKRVDVPKGRVQPIWFGIEVACDAAGMYEGAVILSFDGEDPVRVAVRLTVAGDVIEEHGDLEPWRHARLRWLDSTIAQDDGPTAPYPPLKSDGRRISCLGRTVTCAPDGLPASIDSYFDASNHFLSTTPRPVLAAPVRFIVEGDDQAAADMSITNASPGKVTWAANGGGAVQTRLCGAMEFDGFIRYTVEVEATTPTRVSDIRLEIPYHPDAARYAMGLGVKGGRRPERLDWTWDATLNQDTLWMGDINAGLMLRLMGEEYQKPFMLIYFIRSGLKVPACWDNGGRGGVRVREEDGCVRLTAYSGERELRPGEPVTFMFDLVVTPLKIIDRHEHYDVRYYHSVPDGDEGLKRIAASTANVINIHHANRYNPFINAPFHEVPAFRGLVERVHEAGLKIKLYDTVKEVSVRTPEFFAMFSLNGELMPKADDPGLSFQGSVPYADEWFARMLGGEGYITAWRQRVYDQEMEASLMAAPTSRLNNYFLEGVRWLLEHTGMDGLYFDDVAFDRQTMKRVRKVLDQHHSGCSIDLHSWNYYKNNNVDDSRLAGWGNSMNLYIDNFAFIDRIWFGEGFDYDEDPDFWLIEMSGIPFGMMGEMLQNGGNVWRGMAYGMTCRLPNENDPTGVWKFWDEFGIADSVLLGFWNPDCPVKTGSPGVLATAYRRADRLLVALASWSGERETVSMEIDWAALRIDPNTMRSYAPDVPGFQPGGAIDLLAVTVEPGQGLLIVIEPKA